MADVLGGCMVTTLNYLKQFYKSKEAWQVGSTL